MFGVRDFRGGIVPGEEQVETQWGEGTYIDHRSFKGPGIFKEGKKEEKEMGSKEDSYLSSKPQGVQCVREESLQLNRLLERLPRGTGCS